jgi:predicted nucleotidyltransferase
MPKVSPWSVSRQFSKLVKEGMIKERTEGRKKFYSLNLSSVKTRKICELLEIEKRTDFLKKNRKTAWVLEDFTKKAADFMPEIQSIVLFGSAARGEATSRSDMDVLVLVPNYEEERFKRLMNSIDQLASEVGGRYPLKIVSVVMMLKDFEQSIKEKKRFAADVLEDGIVLFGEERYYHLLSRVV